MGRRDIPRGPEWVFDFGGEKGYRGHSLARVIEVNPGRVRWYLENVRGFSITPDAMRMLEMREGRCGSGYYQVPNQPAPTGVHSHPGRRYYTDDEDRTPSESEPETYAGRRVVRHADGSGYVEAGGPCGPLYFDRNGNT